MTNHMTQSTIQATSNSHIKLKIVTIGGGTGTFPVVQALVQLGVEITCIVAVSDSGGSSGRIRDEFGFQPVGDLRQSLAALARTPSQDWVQKLLLYRFSKGSGLKGHNLGNLILTALQDMTDSTTRVLDVAKTIFHLTGRVLPVTDQTIQLRVDYEDGTNLVGEHHLDLPSAPDKRIAKISFIPNARCTVEVYQALTEANHIIIGPGDLFASLLAVLKVDGVGEAVQNSQAQIHYLLNLMTRRSQTSDMTASDHLRWIEGSLGRTVDSIVVNNDKIPTSLSAAYTQEGEREVVNDVINDQRLVLAPLLSVTQPSRHAFDQVPRSLLRHDSSKLLQLFNRLLAEEKHY